MMTFFDTLLISVVLGGYGHLIYTSTALALGRSEKVKHAVNALDTSPEDFREMIEGTVKDTKDEMIESYVAGNLTLEELVEFEDSSDYHLQTEDIDSKLFKIEYTRYLDSVNRALNKEILAVCIGQIGVWLALSLPLIALFLISWEVAAIAFVVMGIAYCTYIDTVFKLEEEEIIAVTDSIDEMEGQIVGHKEEFREYMQDKLEKVRKQSSKLNIIWTYIKSELPFLIIYVILLS